MSNQPNLRQDVQILVDALFINGIDGLSSGTILSLAMDMKRFNMENGMNAEFDARCDRIIYEMLWLDSDQGY